MAYVFGLRVYNPKDLIVLVASQYHL
jgi:hypothetical protein